MTTLKMDAKKRNSLKTVASKKPPKPYQTVRKSEKATDTSIKQSSTHPKLQTNTPVGLPRSLTGQTGGETVRRSSSLVDISKTENNELINGTNTKCSSDSALVCSLQRDVEILKKENVKLKKELTETRQLYEQLLNEAPSERFDERRVLLLKSQIIQLERQVLLLSEALNSRSTAMLEVDNLVQAIKTTLESSKGSTQSSLNRLPDEAKLDREHLRELCHEIQQHLSASVQSKPSDHLGLKTVFSNPFVNPKKAATLLDICVGGVDHINLKQVGKLEQDLSEMYHDLESLRVCLELLNCTDTRSGHELSSPRTISPSSKIQSKDRIFSAVIIPSTGLRTQDIMRNVLPKVQQCCYGLLTLSLLVPSAPWPSLDFKEEPSFSVTVDDVLKELPPLGSHRKEVKMILGEVLKGFHHVLNIYKQRVNALSMEVDQCRNVHQIQIEHVDRLFIALSKGYKLFQNLVDNQLLPPLEALLTDYNNLCERTSEDNLAHFLLTFKENSAKLRKSADEIREQTKEGLPDEIFQDLMIQFHKALEKSKQ